jgi:hypothetical protein
MPKIIQKAYRLIIKHFRPERELFVILTLLILFFQVKLFSNAGAFWRDEVSTILVAKQASWNAMFAALSHDSFPALLSTLLRLWIASGLGATDVGIRIFGLILSMTMVPALWISARFLKLRPPLLALTLVAFNPTCFYWSSTIRSYALAASLIIILFGLMFAFMKTPTRWLAFLAVTTAIMSVQANYQSTYLIFAICTASSVLCLFNNMKNRAFFCFLIGVPAAISLLPYIPTINAVMRWNIMVRMPLSVGFIIKKVLEALGAGGFIITILWLVLLSLTIWKPISEPKINFKNLRTLNIQKQFYAALIIAIALPATIIFIMYVGYPTQVWYYIPLMALAGIAIETSISTYVNTLKSRIIYIMLTILIVLLSMMPIWQDAHTRRTNIDLIAIQLQREASPKDLIILNPFWYTISFSYYYKGDTPWLALPGVTPDLAVDPYPTVYDLMSLKDPMQPIFVRMRETLERGNRIWFVGSFMVPKRKTRLLTLGPAPDPTYHWNNGVFVTSWSLRVGDFVQTHTLHKTSSIISSSQKVNEFENIPLVVVSGWRSP